MGSIARICEDIHVCISEKVAFTVTSHYSKRYANHMIQVGKVEVWISRKRKANRPH